MEKKSIYVKIAEFLTEERNEGDSTRIILEKDSVKIYPNEKGMIYGYMLNNIMYISHLLKARYFIDNGVNGRCYIKIY